MRKSATQFRNWITVLKLVCNFAISNLRKTISKLSVNLAGQYRNWFAILQFLICAAQFRNCMHLQIAWNLYSATYIQERIHPGVPSDKAYDIHVVNKPSATLSFLSDHGSSKSALNGIEEKTANLHGTENPRERLRVDQEMLSWKEGVNFVET